MVYFINRYNCKLNLLPPKRDVCDMWLKRGLADIDLFIETIKHPEVHNGYLKLKNLSFKIETAIILSKYGLMTLNVQNWIEKTEILDRQKLLNLFIQLFEIPNSHKVSINNALHDCALMAGLQIAKFYADLLKHWISAFPIPADNVSFLIGKFKTIFYIFRHHKIWRQRVFGANLKIFHLF